MATRGGITRATSSRKLKAEATRRQLLDAALETFVEKGYNDTSVADIVAAAQLSVGTFYHHFDSKRTLFQELWNELQDTLRAAASAAVTSGRSAVHSARSEGVTDDFQLFERGAHAFFTSIWRERETAKVFFFGDLPAEFAEIRRRDAHYWLKRNSTLLRLSDSPTDRIVNNVILSAISESTLEILRSADDAEAEEVITAAIQIIATVDRLGSPSSTIADRIQ